MPRQNDFLDGIEWSKYTKPLLPHQMTPAQFREHPLAVHHGTTIRIEAEDIGHRGRRLLSFAGDKFQAMDRLAEYSHVSPDNAASFPRDDSQNAGDVHHYWAVPTAHEAKHYYEDDDSSAHEEGDTDVHGVKANQAQLTASHMYDNDLDLGYYRNIYEGANSFSTRGKSDNAGSPSVAMRNSALNYRKGFTTQSEFVRDAIARGKGHEVHPETMDLYNKGTLDTTRVSNRDVSRGVYGVSDFISPQFKFNHEYYASSPYHHEYLESAIDSKYFPEITPRSELPAFKENKRLDMREIRNKVKTGYAARVRKTYRSLYAPKAGGE